ncbi:unnamed protein product [Urochloa decumbens]|uniref:Uncharacterized protein n=1 Tax=Urochloa decumbens TaxID=240449 RepID=A0ABC9B984_9POAL
MVNYRKHTMIQGLWLLSLVILASSTIVRARIIGQNEDDSDTRTVRASNKIIGIDKGKPCGCYEMPFAFYFCSCDHNNYESMESCHKWCHK